MPTQPTPSADLLELFSSIQGEGLLVGYRQVFMRFPGCNLACEYCDTDFSSSPSCSVENEPGSKQFSTLSNPVNLDRVMALIQNWISGFPAAHHSLSITGGEPLLHAQTLQQWLPHLRTKLPIYLETNGTLPDQLELIIANTDWVAMDIKLHSLSGERTDWEIHRRFLEVADSKQCFVKVVVGEKTPDLELQLAGDLVSSVSEKIPIILQPVTMQARVAVSTRRLLHMQAIISESHKNIRVIPQTHRFMDLL